MKKFFLIMILAATHWAFSADADNKDEKAISMENTLFNHLLGDWQIQTWRVGQDGKWVEGQAAEWNWYKILDGNAIQDDWIAPALSIPVQNGQRQYGTNIRIYNPQKKQWEMAWMSSNGKKMDTFIAEEDSDKIVMTGFYLGTNARITFFNMSDASFDWKLELQQQDESWLEVSRLKGTKK